MRSDVTRGSKSEIKERRKEVFKKDVRGDEGGCCNLEEQQQKK